MINPSQLVAVGLHEPLEALLASFGQYKLLLRFIMLKEVNEKWNPFVDFSFKEDYTNMGQLAIKEEAAGKLRVFALVDV